MSFSSDKDRLLSQITSINDMLHQFLSRDAKVSRPPPYKPRLPLGRLQTDANAFYKGLAECWDCSCSVAHKVGIALCPVPGALSGTVGTNNLQVLLGDDFGGTLLSVHADHDITPNYHPPDLNLDLNRASKIGEQLRERKQRDKAAKAFADNGASTLAIAVSSLTVSSTKGKPQPKASSFKSILKRTTSKIHKATTPHKKHVDEPATQPQTYAHPTSPETEKLGRAIPKSSGSGHQNSGENLGSRYAYL